MRISPSIQHGLRLALGIAILIAMVLLVDARAIGRALVGVDIVTALYGVMVLIVGGILLEATRLWLLFRHLGLVPHHALSMTISAVFFVNITGSMLGGEAWRISRLRRLGEGIAVPAGMLGIQRLIGVISALPVLVLWWFLRGEPAVWSWTGGLGNVALDVVLMAVLAVLSILALLSWRSDSRFAQGLRHRFRHIQEAARGVERLDWIWMLVLGMLALAVRAASMALFVRSLGHPMALLDPVPVMVLATLASVVPLAPANLGVREGVFLVGLTALGVSADDGLSAALLNRAGLVVAGLLGGALLLWELRVQGEPRSRDPVESTLPDEEQG